MMGKKWLLLLIILMLVLDLGSFAFAEETESDDIQMIKLTKEAADVQLSLNDRGYTYSEIRVELSPYFTEQFIDQFIATNMMKESDSLYYVMGTDLPIYYIPFFSYEGDTRVIKDTNIGQTVVYEFFRASTDGPVGYDNHYEAVVYTLQNGVWKVKEIIPQYNPNQFEAAAKEDLNTLIAAEPSVQSNEFEENDDEEATSAKQGVHIFQMIKSFFSSLFGI